VLGGKSLQRAGRKKHATCGVDSATCWAEKARNVLGGFCNVLGGKSLQRAGWILQRAGAEKARNVLGGFCNVRGGPTLQRAG
jgi:hypothetical protein